MSFNINIIVSISISVSLSINISVSVGVNGSGRYSVGGSVCVADNVISGSINSRVNSSISNSGSVNGNVSGSGRLERVGCGVKNVVILVNESIRNGISKKNVSFTVILCYPPLL